jgi:predicted phage gp36 major capsid-like protein
VPKEDHAWAEEMSKRYRTFREERKKLKKLEKEIKELLDKHAEQVTDRTKRGF